MLPPKFMNWLFGTFRANHFQAKVSAWLYNFNIRAHKHNSVVKALKPRVTSYRNSCMTDEINNKSELVCSRGGGPEIFSLSIVWNGGALDGANSDRMLLVSDRRAPPQRPDNTWRTESQWFLPLLHFAEPTIQAIQGN